MFHDDNAIECSIQSPSRLAPCRSGCTFKLPLPNRLFANAVGGYRMDLMTNVNRSLYTKIQ